MLFKKKENNQVFWKVEELGQLWTTEVAFCGHCFCNSAFNFIDLTMTNPFVFQLQFPKR